MTDTSKQSNTSPTFIDENTPVDESNKLSQWRGDYLTQVKADELNLKGTDEDDTRRGSGEERVRSPANTDMRSGIRKQNEHGGNTDDSDLPLNNNIDPSKEEEDASGNGR